MMLMFLGVWRGAYSISAVCGISQAVGIKRGPNSHRLDVTTQKPESRYVSVNIRERYCTLTVS